MTPNIKIAKRTIKQSNPNHVVLSLADIKILTNSRSLDLTLTPTLAGPCYRFKGFPVKLI